MAIKPMKIFSILADKRPTFCIECPINASGRKLRHKDCGKYSAAMLQGTDWKMGGKIPDHRCLITLPGEGKDNDK